LIANSVRWRDSRRSSAKSWAKHRKKVNLRPGLEEGGRPVSIHPPLFSMTHKFLSCFLPEEYYGYGDSRVISEGRRDR